jgi:ABC-type multidrug transport system ATPase subunit
VLLARALAVDAAVLLLDEPTTHLDAPHQRALMRSLAGRARAGVAVAAVLHDLTLALAADRVLVLDRGRLVADGAPADAALRRPWCRSSSTPQHRSGDRAGPPTVGRRASRLDPDPDPGRRWTSSSHPRTTHRPNHRVIAAAC